MRKGSINVQTGDIFPIIKKWLYSDHNIFIRELVSNAVDAIEKRNRGGQGPEKPLVEIKPDAKAKTLTFIDNGVGMTMEEVEKYIGQIALSGARDFIKNLQEQNPSGSEANLIGQFGLGFYSAFMVSDLVEIYTKSFREEAKGVYWSCKGEAEYEIDEREITEVGTKIVLHLNAESQEFLEKARLQEILKTYCNFMRYPVALDGEVLNTQDPIWNRRSTELKEKDYLDFFHYLYPYEQDPVFWIHFNLDYPFVLQGILFFPKIEHVTETRTGNIQLYCKQVFVSDQLKDIVPEFLTLLKGIIDSPEIPLNVSRSALQGDPKIKMISDHIIKKVADALSSRFKNKREEFVKTWEYLAPFIKIGLVQNPSFFEKAKDFLIFETTQKEFLTLSEYQEKYAEKLKDLSKDKKAEDTKYFIYSQKKMTVHSLVEPLHAEGLAAFLTDDTLDPHVIQSLEMQGFAKDGDKAKFERLDAVLDQILKGEKPVDLITGADKKTKSERLKEYFTEYLKIPDLDIEVLSLKADSIPAMIKYDESARRFSEMMRFHREKDVNIPLKHTLVLNANHKLIDNLLSVSQRPSREEILPLFCRQVYDLAKMSQGELSTEDRSQFLSHSVELLEKLTN